MTARTRLYDPENIPFDVPSHKVGDLVLNQGWSQTPQDKSAPAPEAAPESVFEDLTNGEYDDRDFDEELELSDEPDGEDDEEEPA